MIEEHSDASSIVRDQPAGAGLRLLHRRLAADLLTRDEARRMAVSRRRLLGRRTGREAFLINGDRSFVEIEPRFVAVSLPKWWAL